MRGRGRATGRRELDLAELEPTLELRRAGTDRVGRRHGVPDADLRDASAGRGEAGLARIGFEVAAASLGIGGIPALAGVLAARAGLEVIPLLLVVATLGFVALHEAVVRAAPRAYTGQYLRRREPPALCSARERAAASQRDASTRLTGCGRPVPR